MIKFVGRHIIRAPVKSALSVAVALFFVIVLGYLHQTVYSTQSEIDRLYNTTIVAGEVRIANPMFIIRDTILPQNVERLTETGLVQNVYYEAVQPFQLLINARIDDLHEYFWEEFWWYFLTEYGALEPRADPILAFNDIELFLRQHDEVDMALRIPGFGIEHLVDYGQELTPLEILFGTDFGIDDFMYYDQSLQTPIPVIVSEHTLELRGLSVGDEAFFTHRLREVGDVLRQDIVTNEEFHEFLMEIDMRIYPVIIIGSHNGAIRGQAPASTLMPMTALRYIREGLELGIAGIQFEVEPSHNRNLDEVYISLNQAVNFPAQRQAMELAISLQDSELRLVVGQMESNLSLLQTLRPIAITVSLLIGAGLSLLITLQTTKRVAIMRVLGFTRMRTRLTLCFENLAVCLVGAVIGLCAILLFGNYTSAMLPLFAVLYLLGTIIGSAAGAIMVSNRPPLELLQVKE